MEPVILSDCNSVFISHILTGARVNTCVRAVLTNQSSFERVPVTAAPAALEEAAALAPSCPAPRNGGGFGSGWGFFRSASSSSLSAAAAAPQATKPALSSTHRLVVQPRHDAAACVAHGCSLCPSNLCKVGSTAACTTLAFCRSSASCQRAYPPSLTSPSQGCCFPFPPPFSLPPAGR
jgi:hypothetical protein